MHIVFMLFWSFIYLKDYWALVPANVYKFTLFILATIVLFDHLCRDR